MSFSFNVRGATKAEVIEKVKQNLNAVVSQQPVHAEDQAHAQAAAEAFIGMVVENETKDILVSVNGSVWSSEAGIQQVGFGVNVHLADKE